MSKNLKTYSSKGKSTSSSTSGWFSEEFSDRSLQGNASGFSLKSFSSKPLQNHDDNILREEKLSKRKLNNLKSCDDRENNRPRKNSPFNDRMTEKSTFNFNESKGAFIKLNRKKKSTSLKDILMSGEVEDIQFLSERLSEYFEQRSVMSSINFIINFPYTMDAKSKRLRDWLMELGFKELSGSIGLRLTYSGEIDELHTCLKNASSQPYSSNASTCSSLVVSSIESDSSLFNAVDPGKADEVSKLRSRSVSYSSTDNLEPTTRARSRTMQVLKPPPPPLSLGGSLSVFKKHRDRLDSEDSFSPVPTNRFSPPSERTSPLPELHIAGSSRNSRNSIDSRPSSRGVINPSPLPIEGSFFRLGLQDSRSGSAPNSGASITNEVAQMKKAYEFEQASKQVEVDPNYFKAEATGAPSSRYSPIEESGEILASQNTEVGFGSQEDRASSQSFKGDFYTSDCDKSEVCTELDTSAETSFLAGEQKSDIENALGSTLPVLRPVQDFPWDRNVELERGRSVVMNTGDSPLICFKHPEHEELDAGMNPRVPSSFFPSLHSVDPFSVASLGAQKRQQDTLKGGNGVLLNSKAKTLPAVGRMDRLNPACVDANKDAALKRPGPSHHNSPALANTIAKTGDNSQFHTPKTICSLESKFPWEDSEMAPPHVLQQCRKILVANEEELKRVVLGSPQRIQRTVSTGSIGNNPHHLQYLLQQQAANEDGSSRPSGASGISDDWSNLHNSAIYCDSVSAEGSTPFIRSKSILHSPSSPALHGDFAGSLARDSMDSIHRSLTQNVHAPDSLVKPRDFRFDRPSIERFGRLHGHFEAADRTSEASNQVDLTANLSPEEVSVQQGARKQKRLRQSQAKAKRMSMGVQQHQGGHQMDQSLNRSTNTSNCSHHLMNYASSAANISTVTTNSENHSPMLLHPSKRTSCIGNRTRSHRRLSSMFGLQRGNSMDSEIRMAQGEGQAMDLEMDVSFSNGSIVMEDGETVALFDCPSSLLVGGHFKSCFDKQQRPVITPPLPCDVRVVGVRLNNSRSLQLVLFVPSSNSLRIIDVGTLWTCVKASSTGCVLFSRNSPAIPQVKPSCVNRYCCFYLPKEPSDWHSMVPAPNERFNHMDGIADCSGDEDYFLDDGAASFLPTGCSQETLLDRTPSFDDLQKFFHRSDVDAPEKKHLLVDEICGNTPGSQRVGTNMFLVSLVLSFAIADARDHLEVGHFSSVSKVWTMSCSFVQSQALSDLEGSSTWPMNWAAFTKFVSRYPTGKFLSQGVCKDVFCVRSAADNKVQAVSVMDMEDLAARGMDSAVTQELKVSVLCSSLASLKICPHMVEVYSLFQAHFSAPDSLWKSTKSLSDFAAPSAPKPGRVELPPQPKKGRRYKDNVYQYIRMEFCSGGDLESLVRSWRQPSLAVVRSFLFQMCFSLYSGRESLRLRHFDIKLLNFFVTKAKSLLPVEAEAAVAPRSNRSAFKLVDRFPRDVRTEKSLDMRVGFGFNVFSLPLALEESSLVKLADFGTSAVGDEELGSLITAQQFTTLENTPPEYLLCGSSARQCFSADTFPLGLCYLHLLTGYEPYEELLRDVHCPKHLSDQLGALWCTDESESPYRLVKEVIDSLDSSDGEDSEGGEEDSGLRVLADTLYRYTVLLGASPAFIADAQHRKSNGYAGRAFHELYAANPVWAVLVECLALGESMLHEGVLPESGLPREMSGSIGCLAQYSEDLARWSIHGGSDPVMSSVRSRLNTLGEGASALLESMLHFDPAKRCTMHDALCSPFFQPLRVSLDHSLLDKKRKQVEYMYYYRSPHDSRHSNDLADGLSIV